MRLVVVIADVGRLVLAYAKDVLQQIRPAELLEAALVVFRP